MTAITFNLSEDLAKRAVRHFWLRQFGLQGFAIYGLCTILLLYFIVTDNINWFAWVFAIVVVGACILYPATYIFHLKRVKQELRAFSSPTIVWNISADGLISRSALGSSSVKWEAMKRLWCFPDMWLIFFSKYGEQFAILPTAALDEETAQFFF